MVAKDQNVQAAFSEIDVNLQRRADLIPNLVATVKGYAKVEETVLNNIAQARSGLLQARTPDEKLAANDRLNVALLPLMRLQEAYPQLKSNDQFMRLQDELAGTENRIAVARRRYNEAITILSFSSSRTASGQTLLGSIRRTNTTRRNPDRKWRRRSTSRSNEAN